jgi:hypothetical protein
MHLDKLRKTAFIAAVSVFFSVHGSGRSSESVRKIVVSWQDTTEMHFLRDPSFFAQGWHTLPQVSFWKQVINMSGDSCIVNIASCRKPVGRVSREVWMGQTESEKVCYKDSVCTSHCLEPGSAIFVTAGKGEFYEVKKTLPVVRSSRLRSLVCTDHFAHREPRKAESEIVCRCIGAFPTYAFRRTTLWIACDQIRRRTFRCA